MHNPAVLKILQETLLVSLERKKGNKARFSERELCHSFLSCLSDPFQRENCLVSQFLLNIVKILMMGLRNNCRGC